MASSFFWQVKVIFCKNFLLYFRSFDFLIDMIISIVCAFIVYGSTKTDLLKIFGGILLPFSLFGLIRSLSFSFVDEKASKHKESQKIMGLRGYSYNVAWISFAYTTILLNTTVFLVITLWTDSFYPSSLGLWKKILSFYLFSFANMHFIMMLTTFFSRPKLACDIITYIMLITTLLQFVQHFTASIWVIRLICIFPQTAITLIFQASGWNFPSDELQKNFSYLEGNLILLIQGIGYLLLFYYFEQVIQNEYGTQKSKLFFINWIWKKKTIQKNSISDSESGYEKKSKENETPTNMNESSALFKEMELNSNNLKPIIQVQNLTKKFGDFTAVNNLSLTFYEKQILCLLGHNGAGKTTTISLLTGLIKKNSGKIFMNEMDFDDELHEIRQNIGFCSQQDILYDKLTVEEHLRFIGQIKGKSNEEIKFESANLIQQCQLSNQVGKYSKILSGGNKRKLSLAMALMGGSSIVFLDEPSSGLDFNARKEIQAILLSLKTESRTVILTTHHLEEAEHISDRIAIMAKGQLLVLGKNKFIKEKFGDGYNLSVSKRLVKNNKDSKPVLSAEEIQFISSRILQRIPNASINPQSAEGTIIFQLPFQSRQLFSSIFKEIEERRELQLDLKINSLEDAFINIGMDEERFLHPEKYQDTNQLDKYSDFSNIKPPECLNNPPAFSFFNQTFACFTRKFYLSYRSSQFYFSFVFPCIVQVLGIYLIGLKVKVVVFQYIIFGFLKVILLCLLPATFINVLVMERQSKIKYSLNVMGCRILPYWFGSFLFDFLLCIIFTLGIIGGCFAFSFEPVEKWIKNQFIIQITYSFEMIMLSYLISFVFKNVGLLTIFFMNFFGFFMLPLLLMIINEDLAIYASSSVAIFKYEQGRAYLDLGREIIGETETRMGVFVPLFLVKGVLFGILLFLTEWIKLKFFFGKEDSVVRDELNLGHADPDVKAEALRVANPECVDPVKISQLTKTYKSIGKPDFTAVQNNSFGVQNGEILGLLGPNGAGKSTTFNVITAFLPKTSGSVKLKGQEIYGSYMSVYTDVGICPQFNNLYPDLTVNEHLILFGRIKGLSGKDLHESKEYFIQIMQLDAYRKVYTERLSGGNKRKLCVALALIGGPDMQFLDEPSAGVDPIAKRFLWNTLNQSLKLRNGALVLTTHSMEEAESLCSKIGILINGQFICYGSPQQLKDKFGDGYKVSFKTKMRKQVLDEVFQKFPMAKLTAEDNGSNSIGIMFPHGQFNLSDVFQHFYNELTSNEQISDFQIEQTSLASVFTYFSQFQRASEPIQNGVNVVIS